MFGAVPVGARGLGRSSKSADEPFSRSEPEFDPQPQVGEALRVGWQDQVGGIRHARCSRNVPRGTRRETYISIKR